MSLGLLALCCGLAAFACLAGLASLAAWLLDRWLGAGGELDPDARATRCFWLRLWPALAGLLLACGVVVPAFLRFEPRGLAEAPGLSLRLLALCGAVMLLAGLLRGATAWWATLQLRRRWMRQGRAVSLPGEPAPAHAIPHHFPVVTVVGVLRPRLFVAEQVLAGLDAAELRAVLGHEAGHLAARDNLKRLCLRLCPGLPWPAAARDLEDRWAAAAEEAADVRAGAGLELAAALVKTARLAPAGSRLALPAAAFHTGGALARRVRRLAEGPALPAEEHRSPAALAAIPLLLALVAAWSPVSLLVHGLLEALVRLP